MNNSDVAGILEEIGTLLELRGENPFKCRAFHNAARIIGALTEELPSIIERKGLKEIKGIGEGLAEKITEMVAKGSSPYYEELKKSLPPGLPAMLRIQGLGPKKIKLLHEKLKISSIEQLAKAAGEHRLAKIEGFGEKTE